VMLVYSGLNRYLRKRTIADVGVETCPPRSDYHVTLHDLAGSRIHDGRTVGPAAGGTMHPLDDVVTHIHGIGALRHQFDAECILITCRLERLVPPPCALEQGRANWLRRTPVQVIDDGFNRFADIGSGILLLQAMTPRIRDRERTADLRGVVVKPAAAIAKANEPGARVVGQRFVVVV